jgi:hypothetical protein
MDFKIEAKAGGGGKRQEVCPLRGAGKDLTVPHSLLLQFSLPLPPPSVPLQKSRTVTGAFGQVLLLYCCVSLPYTNDSDHLSEHTVAQYYLGLTAPESEPLIQNTREPSI